MVRTRERVVVDSEDAQGISFDFGAGFAVISTVATDFVDVLMSRPIAGPIFLKV